jgi:hypothetical protein
MSECNSVAVSRFPSWSSSPERDGLPRPPQNPQQIPSIRNRLLRNQTGSLDLMTSAPHSLTEEHARRATAAGVDQEEERNGSRVSLLADPVSPRHVDTPVEDGGPEAITFAVDPGPPNERRNTSAPPLHDPMATDAGQNGLAEQYPFVKLLSTLF